MVGRLKRKQITAIDPDVFSELDQGFLSGCGKAQAKGITRKQLSKLSQDSVSLLPEDFLKGLSRPKLSELGLRAGSLSAVEHEHAYTHTHGGDNGGSPQEHDHRYFHSHVMFKGEDHDHDLDRHLANDLGYDPVHDDGTHSGDDSSGFEPDLGLASIIEKNHSHSYEHSHGGPDGGASVLHEHGYDHDHRVIGGAFGHDHLIGKHLSEDQSFDPVHDDGTHSGASSLSELGLGMFMRHTHEYEHEHGNDDRATDVLHNHNYSHFHVITDLPMIIAPGHMHTLMEHLANDNEFDPVHDDGTHST